MSERKKRILLLTIQPPGGSGVQGLIFTKLCKYLQAGEWEFHFAGPAPALSSVLHDKTYFPAENFHLTTNISNSIRYSIRRNRQPKGSPLRLLFGVFQLTSRWIEKLTQHNSTDYLHSGIREAAEKAEAAWDFDMIAGKSPDFRILEIAAELSARHNKPLLAIYDDPHGQRDSNHFYPDDQIRQIEILKQAAAAVFMSPKTLERYVEAKLITKEKCLTITDSYPTDPNLYASQSSQVDQDGRQKANHQLTIAHLGNIPEWRPVDSILESMSMAREACKPISIKLMIYGYLYKSAREVIEASPLLSSQIRIHPAISYDASHAIAERADILLVVIGERHIDNQPSKFFDYLGHKKPILAVGPQGNPIQAIIETLDIGVFCDVRDPQSIQQGIQKLSAHYNQFTQAYLDHDAEISNYSAPAVANRWLAILDKVYAESQIKNTKRLKNQPGT
jgi:glycosyltransferase involved in cell wall biosynthesis